MGVTAKFLDKHEALDPTSDFSRFLRKEKDELQDTLRRLRDKAKSLKEELESIWADQQTAAYELTSVFIHRGSSPSWGHYFFYARNLPEHPESWFKMNDSEVTMVSRDEVLADTTGSTANPYLVSSRILRFELRWD